MAPGVWSAPVALIDRYGKAAHGIPALRPAQFGIRRGGLRLGGALVGLGDLDRQLLGVRDAERQGRLAEAERQRRDADAARAEGGPAALGAGRADLVDRNGRMLAQVTELLQKNPALLNANIDGGKILLVGHSFGGSSVAIAMGDGAPVLGGVLLDPAIADGDLRGALGRIKKPLILIGADEYVSEAVGRNPGASGKVLVQAIIGMALAEGLGILALFLAK